MVSDRRRMDRVEFGASRGDAIYLATVDARERALLRQIDVNGPMSANALKVHSSTDPIVVEASCDGLTVRWTPISRNVRFPPRGFEGKKFSRKGHIREY